MLKALLYKKFSHKMMMKLTTGHPDHFWNIFPNATQNTTKMMLDKLFFIKTKFNWKLHELICKFEVLTKDSSVEVKVWKKYYFQTLRLVFFKQKVTSVNWIILLMLSLLIQTKVIQLSVGHCIMIKIFSVTRAYQKQEVLSCSQWQKFDFL